MDYSYKFIYADIGCQGRISDGGVFRNCSFMRHLVRRQLNLRAPRPLPKSPDAKWARIDEEYKKHPFYFGWR